MTVPLESQEPGRLRRNSITGAGEAKEMPNRMTCPGSFDCGKPMGRTANSRIVCAIFCKLRKLKRAEESFFTFKDPSHPLGFLPCAAAHGRALGAAKGRSSPRFSGGFSFESFFYSLFTAHCSLIAKRCGGAQLPTPFCVIYLQNFWYTVTYCPSIAGLAAVTWPVSRMDFSFKNEIPIAPTAASNDQNRKTLWKSNDLSGSVMTR